MTSRTLSFPAPLDCDAVDARLAEWLDDPAPDPAVGRHVATCARCRALVDELRAVSAAAAALPPMAPPPMLWDGIAARLGAQERPAATPATDRSAVDRSVVDIADLQLRHVRRQAIPQAWRLAAAAVLLVAATASVTYRVARGTAAPSAVATAPAAQSAPTLPAAPAAVPTTVASAEAEPVESAATPATARRLTTRDAAAPAAAVAVSNPAAPDAAVPGAAAYDREIAALRAVVRERRGELDSATVVVLLRNLQVIDQAIAQSRAALARDPHSPFLGDQLTRALGQKVDLLRTAALLPRA